MRVPLFVLVSSLALAANEEFFEAARTGDTAALKSHLDKGVPVDSKWRYDQTALLIASRRGHAEAVKLLIERGADVNATDSFYKMSALVGAASDRRSEVVRLLLAKGAKGKEQVLSMAAGQGNAEMVKVVLESGGLNAPSLNQALALADSRKHTEVAELLTKAGAVKPQAPNHNIDPKLLARYTGTYRNEGGVEQVFEVHEGKLRGGAGGRWVPYGALDDTTFEPVQFPGMWKAVFVVEGDKVKAVEYRSSQGLERYARVEAK
jgi:hypothetical protein